ncbi:hypothetical protein niasHT_012164 [Heterodera trifolii]|uniref:Uncharacterized protein n=1 Tax=Heterodera trifolii TaxID=157864 RepID=A0ABD2KU00_9BILA
MSLLHLLLLLALQFDFGEQSERILRGNFNMKFMCGKSLPATGRLQMKFIAKTLLVSRESIIFDTVLDWEDGGEFVRNVTSKIELMQATGYEIQLKFRTNCFILNKIGECCAHDFIFYDHTYDKWGQNKFVNNRWFGNTFSKDTPLKVNRKECAIRPKRMPCRETLAGGDCAYSLNTKNPDKNGPPFTIDLVDLLVHMNEQRYVDKIFDGKQKWLQVMRVCSPKDDVIKSDDELSKWPICDPIRYGLQHKSYELDPALQNISLLEECPQGTGRGCEPCEGRDEVTESIKAPKLL